MHYCTANLKIALESYNAKHQLYPVGLKSRVVEDGFLGCAGMLVFSTIADDIELSRGEGRNTTLLILEQKLQY